MKIFSLFDGGELKMQTGYSFIESYAIILTRENYEQQVSSHYYKCKYFDKANRIKETLCRSILCSSKQKYIE